MIMFILLFLLLLYQTSSCENVLLDGRCVLDNHCIGNSCGKKNALVTIIESDIKVCSALTLMQQLKNIGTISNTYEYITLVPISLSKDSQDLLEAMNWVVERKELIDFPSKTASENNAFFKVQLWSMTKYNKILFLDSTIILNGAFIPEELFYSQPFSAITSSIASGFFSLSVFVLQPDYEVYAEMITQLGYIMTNFKDSKTFLETHAHSLLSSLSTYESYEFNRCPQLYNNILPIVYFNHLFPDWHDMEHTGRQRNTGFLILSSRIALERVKIWKKYLLIEPRDVWILSQLLSSTRGLFIDNIIEKDAYIFECHKRINNNGNNDNDKCRIDYEYDNMLYILNELWWNITEKLPDKVGNYCKKENICL